MTRFLHTADLQLGKASTFLAPEARDRYRQDRIDAVRAIGEIVRREGVEFVVVAGDVFDSNDVDRSTVVRRSLDAFAELKVPVFLLPGNHDHLGLRSVWVSVEAMAPSNVTVLSDSKPHRVMAGVEVVGAPWTSKRPLRDPLSSAYEGSPPPAGVRRVLVGHGMVDEIFPVDRIDQRMIRLAGLEAALADGRFHYAALGDRHSFTKVGGSGRVFYPGAPEPTSWDETDPGQVLVVDLGAQVEVRPVRVGRWHFDTIEVTLDSAADIETLESRLAESARKECRAVRIVARGSLTVSERARLNEVISELSGSFGQLELAHTDDLITRPEHVDPDELGLQGYQRRAYEELLAAATNGQGDEVAAQALVLLDRLVRRGVRTAA